MRTLFFLFLLLILQVFVMAQPSGQWTSRNKRAVAAMDKAVQQYQKGEIEQALNLVGKAIRADSSFIEAYILMAEISMDTGRDSLAILALEYAVAINPGFYPTNLYHLGNLYIGQERYERALLVLNRYKTLPDQSENLLQAIERSIATCHFAIHAMKNPVMFNPANLGEGINSSLDEFHPSLTVDEKQLLFTRADIEKDNPDGIDENLYISQFRDYVWKPARKLGSVINTRFNEGAAAISPDGQMIVFTMCEIMGSYGHGRNGYGSCDLYITFRNGGSWTVPVNLGSTVNTSSWESQPAFDADGKTLYFIRSVRSGRMAGNSDIFITTMGAEGKWSPLRPLPVNINTPGRELSVFVHPDGQTLFFSSDGHPGMGGLDIFISRKTPEGEWGDPVNLGYPVNTSKDEAGFVIGASGKTGYFFSDRESGYGGHDIWSFELDPSLRPYPVTYLKGIVFDAETTKPLTARFELINLKSGETVASSFSDPITGEFLLGLPSGQAWALNVNQNEYLFYSDHFEMPENATALKPYEKDIPLQPIRKGETVVLKNIFFDHDQYTFKPESMVELKRLASLLKENPTMKIEIGGHTDNTGTRKYNETLSENRAKAVLDFLYTQGISPARLSCKGYADLVPIADNKTEEGRAQNRRTEFKITGN